MVCIAGYFLNFALMESVPRCLVILLHYNGHPSFSIWLHNIRFISLKVKRSWHHITHARLVNFSKYSITRRENVIKRKNAINVFDTNGKNVLTY